MSFSERTHLPRYLVGLDLGRRVDYTAIVVLQQSPDPEPVYRLLHAERWRGRPYGDVVPRLEAIRAQLYEAVKGEMVRLTGNNWAVHPDIEIVVDQTGVGVAVVDDVIRAAGIAATGVTITAGTAVSRDGDDWRVPKAELIGRLEVVVENHRLRYPSADRLPAVEVLVSELQNFRARTTKLGHDTYGAGDDWREHNHDDVVLAAALAVWFGERRSEGLAQLMETAAAIGTIFAWDDA